MKKFFARLLNSLPKRIAAGALIALAVTLPVAASAADTVTIEGALGVANVTAGDTQYAKSVNASYDQVVKVEVYYHNKENPDSGKIAQNLHVKINMPTTAGAVQKVSGTISADNSNTINDSVAVNLNRSDATLQYIPGSAVWKHNVGTNTNIQYQETKLSDAIVTSSQGLVLEDEKPCYNFSATVTVLARVMVPGVKVTKQVEKADQTNQWSTSNTANPGDTLKYMIGYQNTGNTVQNQVVVRDNLPPRMTLVPGTTVLTDASNPNGVKINSDDITQGGVNIGNFGAGANAYLVFEVKVPDATALACGETTFTNVGVAHPQSMNEYENTASTVVNNKCSTPPASPSYSCDLLTVDKLSGREIEAKVKYTATNGATLKTVTYNFGDSSTPLTTDKTDVKYTYAQDGTYNVTAQLVFSVNGQDKTTSSDDCMQPVSFTTPSTPTTPAAPTTPSQLPNTGAGNVIALFASASVAGAVAYRLFLARRLARES